MTAWKITEYLLVCFVLIFTSFGGRADDFSNLTQLSADTIQSAEKLTTLIDQCAGPVAALSFIDGESELRVVHGIELALRRWSTKDGMLLEKREVGSIGMGGTQFNGTGKRYITTKISDTVFSEHSFSQSLLQNGDARTQSHKDCRFGNRSLL